MATINVHNDFGAQKSKIYHYFHFFPSICEEVMGTDVMILVFLFVYFNWRLIALQYCFLPLIDMNQPWVYMCPPIPEPPTPLPPHPIPLGCPRAPALSALFMQQFALVIYFIYSNIHVSMLFSNHPTLIFSHGVQKSVIYIRVSFAVLHIGSSPSFQIPYICVNILY